jgi:hypothetical protein
MILPASAAGLSDMLHPAPLGVPDVSAKKAEYDPIVGEVND